jgi:glycerophosphoryl diester phosphodiesterase
VQLPHLWSHRQIIAHRGSRVLWPENTMLAFGSSLDSGADHLETDLQLTADGHLVCFHDATVERTTDGSGPVSSFTLKELRDLDAGFQHRMEGDFPFRGRGLRVPTFGEVLATFPGIGVVVDLKHDGLEHEVASLLNRMRAWERVIIGSFSDARLGLIRSLAPGRPGAGGWPAGSAVGAIPATPPCSSHRPATASPWSIGGLSMSPMRRGWRSMSGP